MTYQEAVLEIEEIPKYTTKNPLEETRGFFNFLKAEYNFSEKMLGKIIHVAGTNGKGSVCAFLNAICRSAGLKTGLFTSPHLITTRERFIINSEMMEEEVFVNSYNLFKTAVAKYNEIKSDYHPTYFEILFFIMIFAFKDEELDYLILETGLGGRLDTTNIIENPAISVITEIGFDHMAYLGNTIESIAKEKAGIIKNNAPVVFTDKRKAATKVIEAKAKELKTRAIKIRKSDYKINKIGKKCIDFSVFNRYYEYNGLELYINALYQVENATLAIAAAENLGDSRIGKEEIIKGITSMRWPGRMEELLPNVFVDGAHNEDGIEAFTDTLKSIWKDNECTVVFSAVSDKNYESMIRKIIELSFVRNIIFTHIPGSRGASIEELTDGFKDYADKKIYAFEDIEDAINKALSIKREQGENEAVFFVGSLYLVGIIKDYFCEKGLEL